MPGSAALVTEATVRQFAQGLEIGRSAPTAPAVLEAVSSHPDAGGRLVARSGVTVTEGKFHQVKRMFQAVGMEVLYLKRLRMGTLVLDEQLKPGEMPAPDGRRNSSIEIQTMESERYET